MLSRRTSVLLALAATLLVTLHCRKPEQARPTAAPETIASIGSRSISRDDFVRYLERNAGAALSQLAAPASSALLDQYIDETLRAERAADNGITVSSAAVAEALRNDPSSTAVEKRDEMQRARLLTEIASKIPPATAQEISDYYNRHQDEFRTGEQVHVRQILVHNEADAQAAQKEIARGETFESVSKKYSKAPNAARGGDIGYVERGQLPKIFEDVVFTLKPGKVSSVVKSDVTFFHLFKVDDIRPAGQISADSAKPLIEERLREEKLRNGVERLVAETATAKGVTVYKNRLGFPYAGRYGGAAE
jgi:peptidyl-prolyl cis-trans isomerase C